MNEFRCPNCGETNHHRRGYICQNWTIEQVNERLNLHAKYHWPLPWDVRKPVKDYDHHRDATI